MRGTIGIIGSSHGSGVTFLGLALATFCASGRREKTAFLDFSGNRQMERLLEGVLPMWFFQQTITIFPSCQQDTFIKLTNQDYERYIVDFGCNYERFRDEFLSCEIQLAVLDHSLLRKADCSEMLEVLNESSWQPDRIHLLNSYFDQPFRSGQRNQRTGLSIPFIENPLHIHNEVFEFLYQFLPIAARKIKKRKLSVRTRRSP